MPRIILQSMLQDAAELGANAALAEAGLITKYLSKADAYRMYGESQVDRWIKEGLVKQIKDGGHSAKVRIDRLQIGSVAKASNRPSYMMVSERRASNEVNWRWSTNKGKRGEGEV